MVLSVKKILKYLAHAVARATDEVVGDMSEANFLLSKIGISEIYNNNLIIDKYTSRIFLLNKIKLNL